MGHVNSPLAHEISTVLTDLMGGAIVEFHL